MILMATSYQLMPYIQHPICIDYNVPSWFKGIHIKCLAPSIYTHTDWKTGRIPLSEYRERYTVDTLRKQDPFEIIRQIEYAYGISDSSTFVTVDPVGRPSFRDFVLDWLHQYTGCQIKDFNVSEIHLRKRDMSIKLDRFDILKRLGINNNQINEMNIDELDSFIDDLNEETRHGLDFEQPTKAWSSKSSEMVFFER